MIFDRVKSLDAILATAEKKSLHRSLGAFQLTMLGIGAIIGTGIFVLTAAAAQKAGPGMMVSFMVAGFVCAVAALCYSELASMVPVSGSAYTYTYAVMGELLAWMVGWALVLEYAVAASAVCVGWSGYVMGLIKSTTGFALPVFLSSGPAWGLDGFMPTVDFAHGIINLPAIIVAAAVTWLLVIGTSESAKVNAVLVAVKIVALTAFIVISLPIIKGENFTPFMPTGLMGHDGLGVIGAAASIFFAYVGFDAVSTAAEETKNPQRNVPIGLIGSLAICTIFYLLVAAGVIGTVGAQPVRDLAGNVLSPDGLDFANRCAALTAAGEAPIVCSKEALAETLRRIDFGLVGDLVGLAASIALPSVILMMIYGQTRIFFVMARDGLLPEGLADVHPKYKTPWKMTIFTGICVAVAGAFFPVGQLADISNSGTLFAFFMVAIAVMMLRRTDPDRFRPFRTPLVWVIAPVAAIGCLGLYLNLPFVAKMVLPVWGAIGLLIYFFYSRGHSHVGRGLIEVHEEDADVPPSALPPI
jgi:basic amino acid/polyamine antiporter, APA family